MYELYYGDETTMPCTQSRRFKNFRKSSVTTQAPKKTAAVPRPPQPPQTEAIEEIIVPEEVESILSEYDVTEQPFIFIRSNLGGKQSKGDAYAIGFDEFLVIMWRKGDEPFKLVKLEHYDIVEVSGGVEDDDSIIVLMISTEKRTYSLWFSESQSDELVTFINSWKYHQVHRIGGKTEYEFEEKSESTVAEPDISGVPLVDLPRTVLFGTILIDQVADGHNITELDLEYLSMTITNPDLLALCIQNFKRDVTQDVKELIKSDFNDQQKLMLMSNMADLAYRNGDAHDLEIKYIKEFGEFISFDEAKLLDLIDTFKVKNDPTTLESY